MNRRDFLGSVAAAALMPTPVGGADLKGRWFVIRAGSVLRSCEAEPGVVPDIVAGLAADEVLSFGIGATPFALPSA